jgi:THO complex subunit 2
MVCPIELEITDVLTSIITGRFLLGILSDLFRWHQDEQLFMNDNRSKGARVSYFPGFMMRFSNKSTVAAEDLISWQDFHVVVKKWHRKLLKVCLKLSV